MTSHPSLLAPAINANLIAPIEKMARNEACWCRSGLKFKNCHLDREKQKLVTKHEFESARIAELKNGYCSYPDKTSDPCSSTISNSHTIQKKGGLSAIAEDYHVLTFKPLSGKVIDNTEKIKLRRIGINNASIFPGFCSKHDESLFKSIEGKSIPLNKDAAFLFSYRAIAYERFAKEAEFRISNIHRTRDRGMPFAYQAEFQKLLASYIAGLRNGIRDVNRWKGQFDEYLISGARNDFHFVAIRFDRVLPIVACSTIQPQFDLQGNQLQRLGRIGDALDHMALTVTAFEDNTILVLGWIGGIDAPAKHLADSFLGVPDARKANALTRLLFIHTDNLFIRPSWWDALPATDKGALNIMMQSGTPSRLRTGSELADDETTYVTAGVNEMIAG